MPVFNEMMNHLTLLEEYQNWIKRWGIGRNDQDLRFGQYLINKYGTGSSCPEVFYEESAITVYTKAWSLM